MNKYFLAPFILALGFTAGSANAGLTYDNGSITGKEAYPIYNGYSVTDSFGWPGNAAISWITFGEWVNPGDQPTQVEYLISTEAYGGKILDMGIVSLWGNFDVGKSSDGKFEIFEVVFGPHVTLNVGGTYWLQLQNAQTKQGGPSLWDVSYGPSIAYTAYTQYFGIETSTSGPVPSNSFGLSVPIPAAIWLAFSGLAGLCAFVKHQVA